jgi:hypothetical protein
VGPNYELREWLGKYYIVYADDTTNWKDTAKLVTYKEYEALEKLDDEHRIKVRKALLEIINK